METKKTAVFGILALLIFSIVALVSLSATASAVPVAVDFVKIDGDIVSGNEVIEVDRNTDLEIKVRLLALASAEDVRVEAMYKDSSTEQYPMNQTYLTWTLVKHTPRRSH